MLDILPLVHKAVPFKFRGAELRLELSHALFSSFDVDAGTRLLLKVIGRDEVLAGATSILDEGSGVGVIGIAVARAFPGARVLARDRDLLACAFTERNRRINKADNLRVRAGLLAADAPAAEGPAAEGPAAAIPATADGPFGYILSNIPAKAGGPVIEAFLRWSHARLVPGGRLAVVVVKPLADLVQAGMAAAGFAPLPGGEGGMHRVFVGEKGGGGMVADRSTPAREAPNPDSPILEVGGLDLSAYRRGETVFHRGDERWRARGYWGLPDFDSLGWAPSLAADLLDGAARGLLIRDVLVVNPGAGHIPILIGRRFRPERLDAAGRDLLSLAATGENLAWSLAAPGAPAAPAFRAIDVLRLDELPAASYDLLVEFPDVEPDHDWIAPFWERALRLPKRGASILVVLKPTEHQRLENRRPSGFTLRFEKKRKGYLGAVYRRE